MTAHRQSFTWTSAGFLLALLSGSPAIADDTELLLLNAATLEDDTPNILFILDTSGSMKEIVRTKPPYDQTVDYEGDCKADTLYWTNVDVTPECSEANNQHFTKNAFVCNTASGPMAIGSYTDTMAQSIATGDAGTYRWQELEPGNADGLVECQADSGLHGETGGAPQKWAWNSPDGTRFTDHSNLEISWGSAPAGVVYTVYDGNYLNWTYSPDEALMAKIDILKGVTKAVLSSVTDVNVGVMRFNGNDGGAVIKAMSDIDADRQAILDTIDNLPADGNTPLSETMYEAALYWRGMSPHFGGDSLDPDPSLTDANALNTTSPETYKQPDINVCSNYNILVTDGEPVDDDDTVGLIDSGNLPEFEGSCDGNCLDEIAEYLGDVDVDTAADGNQSVTTHTIGFDINLDILQQTAEKSGGKYFLADDVNSLATALLHIVGDITERSLSFTAPAVSVNSFNRTQHLNDLYLNVFAAKPNVHWPGNLKKFTLTNGRIEDANGRPAVDPGTGFILNTAKSFWTDGNADGSNVLFGGAAQELPLPSARKLFTENDSASDLIAITLENSSGLNFGLTGATGEPTPAELIDWMHGVDVRDEALDPDEDAPRYVMGDPLHSQPAAVVYGGSEDAPDVVVFTGTNDGYLHAIDGDSGEELWAFVPRDLLEDMNLLYFDPASNSKHYGIDGDIVPVVMDENNDGIIAGEGDFVYLLFGLRRGGNSYYALNVTKKDSPKLLWKASITSYPEFGQTWSTPVVSRVLIEEEEHIAVVVGGGYDIAHDDAYPTAGADAGAGIHMLDLETGTPLWSAGPLESDANLKLGTMTHAIPTQIRVIDISGDGRADRMYAADLGGQIWRFDIRNGKPANDLVAGGVIAQLGAEGADEPTTENTRRFYNSPDVAIFTDPLQKRRFISISIGSGYRAHPLNTDTTDMFFSIRDPDVYNQVADYANYDVVTINDLEPVTTGSSVTVGPEDRGWRFELPADQAILADSTTFDSSVFVVSFSPGAESADPCEPRGGRNFLYRINVANGGFLPTNLDSAVDDPATEDVTELPQGGISGGLSVLFLESTEADCEGSACGEPGLTLCVGIVCGKEDDPINPVRTFWTQDGVE